MKREDLKHAYEPMPQALEQRVAHTLAHLDQEKPRRRIPLRTAVIVTVLLVMISGICYGLIASKTVDIFGWFYGEDKRQELLAGEITPSGQSYQLGDVVFTVEDAIYSEGMVYGTGTIKVANDENIVLIPPDYMVDDPAGYLLHFGNEDIPEDAPSYKELAKEKGAKILLVQSIANGILNPDGTFDQLSIGYLQMPQADGSIIFTFEFEAEDKLSQKSYDLSMDLSSWEVTPEGKWLRGEPENTYLTYEWIVTMAPVVE